MKLSIAVVCTILVAFVVNTAMVDAKPNQMRRGRDHESLSQCLLNAAIHMINTFIQSVN
ncbi:hypothetical protein BDF19DRAFT_425841 [Syncephalis fuscata]|nr:hypothetical protein BDF19DRAFT_425841 [Syncephalis fuscata]